MKKRICIITLSLMFAAGAIAAPAANKVEKGDSTAVEQTVTVDSTVVSEHKKEAKKEVEKVSKPTREVLSDEKKTDSKSGLLIIVCCVAVLAFLALGAALYACILVRNALRQIEEIFKQSQEAEDRDDKSQYLSAVQVKQLIDESVKALKQKMAELEEQKKEPVPQQTVVETAEIVNKPMFMPQTYYGVCLARHCGVIRNQLSLQKDPSHLVKIETVSETEAKFSLVDGLSNTQFGALADFAVEIIEGNPREYSSILQLEEGAMQLEDDAWIIKRKIKVKLS